MWTPICDDNNILTTDLPLQDKNETLAEKDHRIAVLEWALKNVCDSVENHQYEQGYLLYGNERLIGVGRQYIELKDYAIAQAEAELKGGAE